ncbi:MAG: sulfite exporter TauE/SafE family protein [Reyranellaceae bacterium]
MTPGDHVVFLAGAFIAAFVSGLSGFAYALVSIAFWVWLFPLSELTPLVLFGAVISQCVAVPTVWRTVDWPTLFPMLGASLVCLPLGVWLIAYTDLELFRLSFGLLLIAYAVFQLAMGTRLRVEGGGKLADAAIGAVGGVMGGLAGLTGAVPAVWGVLRGWDKLRHRGLMTMLNAISQIIALAMVAFAGYIGATTLWRWLWMLPFLISGAWIGTLAMRFIPPASFRVVVLGLLLASGMVLTVQNGWRAIAG